MNFSEIKVDLTNPSSTVPPTIHDKPITDLPLKTPISFLQEICFRIHATPSYSLCPSEAQCSANEPSFLYRVVVDDMIAFGKGSSKKRAKHKAAWSMIEQCYAKLKLVEDPLIKTIEQYLFVEKNEAKSKIELKKDFFYTFLSQRFETFTFFNDK